MKKKASAVFISLLLLLAVAGIWFVNLGKTNFIPQAYTEMTIENPKNMTYNVNAITLNFSAETNRMIYDFFYSLDRQDMERISMSIISQELENPAQNPQIYRATLKGSRVLSNLSEGLHNVSFYHIRLTAGEDPKNGEIMSSATAEFIIDTVPPEISILSLENKTRYSPDVELDFTVNESVSQVTYSLDGKENVTLSENTLLSGLPTGDHNVTFFATDEAGNTSSQTVHFTIAEPFPTTIAVASVVLVAVVGLGMFIFLRKRKQQRDSHDF